MLDNKKVKILIAFLITLIIVFFIDWLTKYYLFNKTNFMSDNGSGVIPNIWESNSYSIIGVRSYAHFNTTLLSFMNFSMPLWAHHVLNFSLVTVFIVAVWFTKKMYIAIPLGMITAGMLGNALDKALTDQNFVRDIIFTPWADKGTFNFADLFVVVGCAVLFIGIISSTWADSSKREVDIVNDKKLKK